jgi:antitoxin ParD1/3/4
LSRAAARASENGGSKAASRIELRHYVSLSKRANRMTKVLPGRYTSSSEVVREALRFMEKVEQQEAEKLNFLRNAWKEGIDSGDDGEVDFTTLKKEARASRLIESLSM